MIAGLPGKTAGLPKYLSDYRPSSIYSLIWNCLRCSDLLLFNTAFLCSQIAKLLVQATTAVFFGLLVDPLTKHLPIETATLLFLLFASPAILLLNLLKPSQARPCANYCQLNRRRRRNRYGRLPYHLRIRIKSKYQASPRPRHYCSAPNYRLR